MSFLPELVSILRRKKPTRAGSDDGDEDAAEEDWDSFEAALEQLSLG